MRYLTDAERNAFTEGLNEGQRKAQRWIPVSERLPEEGQPVLVYLPETNAMRFGMWEGKSWVYAQMITIDNAAGITHWMPLPPPPKAEG